MGSFLANGKNIPNRDDGKTFQTEGLKKAAKYWPQGRCGKKATLPMADIESLRHLPCWSIYEDAVSFLVLILTLMIT